VGKIKFHHFWLRLEKFRKNPLVSPPGKNPSDAHFGHHCGDIARNEAKCKPQRGPTAFDLRTILQKSGKLRATSTKWCIKQQGSHDLKLKKIS